MDRDEGHAEQLRLARARQHILAAVVAALDRRNDVSALIAESDDVATARASLAAMLQIDDTGAQAVLTLHWSALTRARHRQAREDLAEIRSHVHLLEREPGYLRPEG